MKTIKKPNFTCCFVNTEDKPVKTRHIAWSASISGDYVVIDEIVERFYPHPDAPEDSLIQVIIPIFRAKLLKSDQKAAAILNAINSQNILNEIFGKTNEGF